MIWRIWEWVNTRFFDHLDDFAKPVVLGFILTIILGLLTFAFANLYPMLPIEKPDFSILVDPPTKTYQRSMMADTVDIKIYNVHNIPKNYDYNIELAYMLPEDIKQNTEISLNHRYISLKGKSGETVKMTYIFDNHTKIGTYPIKIAALGDHNLERNCTFYLEVQQ